MSYLYWSENVIMPEHGCRISYRFSVSPHGKVRMATFGRLNMTSNAHCGVWVN